MVAYFGCGVTPHSRVAVPGKALVAAGDHGLLHLPPKLVQISMCNTAIHMRKKLIYRLVPGGQTRPFLRGPGCRQVCRPCE